MLTVRFSEVGYMSDVLWMQAVYEQKYKKGDYRATLQELAQQPDNEWSYARKRFFPARARLGLTKKQFPSSALLEYNAKREWRGDANNE